eukprot:59728_1
MVIYQRIPLLKKQNIQWLYGAAQHVHRIFKPTNSLSAMPMLSTKRVGKTLSDADDRLLYEASPYGSYVCVNLSSLLESLSVLLALLHHYWLYWLCCIIIYNI